MKPWLSHAATVLRAAINVSYPDRDKTSDGWLGDARHAARASDHNPEASSGVVRAIDIDRDLSGKSKPDIAPDLADQIRLCAKAGDRRIAYVIFQGRIASPKKAWRWRAYDGINRHDHHIHISFTPEGDKDSRPFLIPLLGD